MSITLKYVILIFRVTVIEPVKTSNNSTDEDSLSSVFSTQSDESSQYEIFNLITRAR